MASGRTYLCWKEMCFIWYRPVVAEVWSNLCNCIYPNGALAFLVGSSVAGKGQVNNYSIFQNIRKHLFPGRCCLRSVCVLHSKHTGFYSKIWVHLRVWKQLCGFRTHIIKNNKTQAFWMCWIIWLHDLALLYWTLTGIQFVLWLL
jgi:hypothetical protein